MFRVRIQQLEESRRVYGAAIFLCLNVIVWPISRELQIICQLFLILKPEINLVKLCEIVEDIGTSNM